MENKKDTTLESNFVNVSHDLQRQLLEMTSFLRVMNNFYKKKQNLQMLIRPKGLKGELNTYEDNRKRLKSDSNILNSLSKNFLSRKDSFKFPDSIMLFEAWMHLGIQALYPRVVIQFKFPGILKGEKARNLFQFIFATSRGFGFPLYFGPEFYHYKFKPAKIFDPLLKWAYTVSHRANQFIVIGNKRLKFKRHHPGEFESVIISEYNDHLYKGIDTLLHGYFKDEAKSLGKFTSLRELLQNSIFAYSVGDHAMIIEKKNINKILKVPLITNETINERYEIDFKSYIESLLNINEFLNKKINFYRENRNNLINKLKKIEKFKFRLEQSKHFAKEFAQMSQKLSTKYPIIDKYGHYKTLMEKVRALLFTTPIYTHAIHDPQERDNTLFSFDIESLNINNYDQESANSVLLSFIKNYEKKHDFIFEEIEVLNKLNQVRDQMTKLWVNFKRNHFKFALSKLNELSMLKIEDKIYEQEVNKIIDNLLPIIAIYEIFNRPLFESVYPESIPQNKKLGSYFARFLASKYNPIGTKLMKLFNRLAFQNWGYFILKQKINRKVFFNYILKLPIWKYIPKRIKNSMLHRNSKN